MISESKHVPPVTRMLDHIGRTGRLGRELAVRLDLVRSVSFRHAWRRFRLDALAAKQANSETRTEPAYLAIWRDAAESLGADLIELPAGLLEIRTKGAITRVWRQCVMLDDAVTLRYALQKALVQELLSSSRLPIPEYLEFHAANLASAVQFLEAGPTPCVVKPVANGLGSGVTCGVRSIPQLMRARLRGWRNDDRLLIERQIPGDNYRLLFLDGVLLDGVRRHPPRVVGDGRSTVEQLIEAENRRRLDRRDQEVFRRLQIDLDCIFTLGEAGFTVGSVLPADTSIPIKTVVNQNSVDDNETVSETVEERLIDEARAAVERVGLRLAGVDIVTTDLSKSLAQSEGAILEVNGTPGLSYHYEVLDRAKATRVAVPILEALLRQHR